MTDLILMRVRVRKWSSGEPTGETISAKHKGAS